MIGSVGFSLASRSCCIRCFICASECLANPLSMLFLSGDLLALAEKAVVLAWSFAALCSSISPVTACFFFAEIFIAIFSANPSITFVLGD